MYNVACINLVPSIRERFIAVEQLFHTFFTQHDIHFWWHDEYQVLASCPSLLGVFIMNDDVDRLVDNIRRHTPHIRNVRLRPDPPWCTSAYLGSIELYKAFYIPFDDEDVVCAIMIWLHDHQSKA